MRTITLPPDLEDCLAAEAQRRGTTPELLAVDTLRGSSAKMLPKETAMIEITEEQRQSVGEGKAVRVRENEREYVLLRPDVYDRLAQGYDDDPWDAEELDRLREESVELLDRYGKDA